MKKLVMIAATTAALSSSALAEMDISSGNMFYAKVNVGANRMQKFTEHGVKSKSKTAPIFIVGVGYYAMNNLRTDLTLEVISNPILKGSGTASGTADPARPTETTPGVNIKRKANIGALMVNAYIDMFDVSVAGIFAGAGVGFSQVKDKVNITASPFIAASASTKNATNFAYQLTLGATGEVADGVKAELAYSWRDYGKVGKYKDSPDGKRAHYRGHNLMAGVKFDL
ncbi:MAG: outer membrane protein [Janthinobacterium lividum]